jgi:diguanylate cyclase (GGDEF)-like protein/PAS domain S-box-containing protein
MNGSPLCYNPTIYTGGARVPVSTSMQPDSTQAQALKKAKAEARSLAARMEVVQDPGRLAALRSLEMLDTAREPEFDRLAELAASICQVPMAAVTLIDERRQWFKSTVGIDMVELDLALSFCTYGIQQGQPVVVSDARDDARFARSPLVLGEPHIRFYACVPLATSEGYRVGTLVVVDQRPQQLSPQQLAGLETLASQAMLLMELRRQRREMKAQQDMLYIAGRVARIGGWHADLATRQMHWTMDAANLHELDARAMSFEQAASFYPEPWLQRLKVHFRLCAREGVPFDEEMELVTARGRRIWVRVIGEPVRRDGAIVAVQGAVQDIHATWLARQAEQEALRESALRARILAIQQEISTAQLPLDEICTLMAQRAMSVLTATGVEIELLEGQELVSHGFFGETHRPLGARMAVRTSIAGRVVTTGEPQYCADSETDPRVNRRICREVGVRSMLLVPLRNSGEVVGVLRATAREPHAFSNDQTTSLLLLSESLGAVIERIRFSEVLRQSEFQYRRLFEHNPHPMWVYERESLRIVAANLSAQLHYGYSEEEFQQLEVPDLWPADAARQAKAELNAIRADTQTVAARRQHLKRNGEVIDVEVSAGPITFNGRPARLALISDVTQRLAAERELARVSRAQRMLSACNEQMIRASDEQALLHEVCRIAVEIGGYRLAWVTFVQPGPEHLLQLAARYGESGEFLDRSVVSCDPAQPASRGIMGRTVLSGKTAVVPDIRADQGFGLWRADLEAAGLRAAIGLPLRHKAEPFGALCLYVPEPMAFSCEEIQLLEELANDLAFGIMHLRSEVERQRSDARVRQQASLLEKAQDAIIVRSLEHDILFWNSACTRLYGWTPEEALGRSIAELLYHDPTDFYARTRTTLERGEWTGELVQYHRNGNPITVEGRWTLVRDEQGDPSAILAINTDITARKQAEAAIYRLAYFDSLTGLPNRQRFSQHLSDALQASAQTGQYCALLLINLDSFKTLNETMGHLAGDTLLRQVATRLSAATQASDEVARLGADEFIVLLQNLGTRPEVAAVRARTLGQELLDALAEPFPIDGYNHMTSACIGMACGRGGEVTASEALKQVDLALTSAKQSGRSTIKMFESRLMEAVAARVELEADLRRAVQQGELLLHYQPQVDASGRAWGAEALVRWNHPSRGLVSPATFIPLAEETGLILPLGQWVLQTACAVLQRWQQEPALQHLVLAVNVSAVQFRHPDFVPQVQEVLRSSGVKPCGLKLELTESLLIYDMDAILEKMHTLKALGVGFSLDDFGTGYSSLSYLRRLPLDQLKIDQSFTRGILESEKDRSIARTIVALGHSLQLQVIAEGVESVEQQLVLQEMGCHAYQGYLFSRPLPQPEAEVVLRQPPAHP